MMTHITRNWRPQTRLFPLLLGMSLLFTGSFGLLTSSPVHAQQAKKTATGKASTPGIGAVPPQISWPAFDGGGSRSGNNTAETLIQPSTVNRLTLLWKFSIDGTDSSPIELANAQTSGGTKSIIFMTSKAGSLLARDADSGSELWKKTTSGPKYTTSSPALDPSKKYVYSYGLDGKVHKYAVYDGTEVKNRHWPETTTLMPEVEKGSSSLNIANGYLYVTHGGYPGDAGHYEGHVVAIRLSDGKKTVFNALCATIHQLLGPDPHKANYCSHVQAAIWGRGGAVVDPITHDVFVTTGNGDFDANHGGHDYGDSILKLTPDVSKLLDSYTPREFARLQAIDQDLGSAAPAMLPKQAHSSTPYMLVQGGKDRTIRLIDRNNMSLKGHPNHVGGEVDKIHLSQDCDIDSHPVAWNDTNNVTWVFITNHCNGLLAYKIITDQHGHSRLQQAYYNPTTGGSSPFIAHNILYVQGDSDLRAMDPTTGNVLWQSTQDSAGATIGSLHWQSPIVVNGNIYVVDNNHYFSLYEPILCGAHKPDVKAKAGTKGFKSRTC